MKADGVNDVIGVNDANYADVTGMFPRCYHDFTIVAIGTIDSICIIAVIGIIGTIFSIGIIVAISIIVWPIKCWMYHYCLQWIIIAAIGANVAIVAIGHYWRHKLLLDILTFISPRNGANRAT